MKHCALLSLLPSLLFAYPALFYHWIVAKDFELRVGFALDGFDLLSGYVLSILSLLCKLHEIW